MCRAAMPDSAATVHRFSDGEAARRQREIFCCTQCFDRCEHYKAWKHFVWDDE